jgi:serine/threonine protein kinase
MTPERWQQVKEIFHSALNRAPKERAAFLAGACGGDEMLRQEVESLISSHEKDGSFIDSPAYEGAAEILTTGEELIVGQRVGHYQIISTLGKGGMGEVYLAEDTRLGRKMALKFLPADFTSNPERLRRFEQEARAASSLNHPNIITIYEVGKADKLSFIAMEFIDGETLRQKMINGPMKIAQALNVAEQIASALAAAHAAHLVHRDIKPENVIVRPDGYVKVLDFGLVKLGGGSELGSEDATRKLVRTSTGLVMGTATYMSPEQARGLDVDDRTDIWSLGVVLYEMLSGQAPFGGETPSDILVSILEHDPPALGNLSPQISETLEWIVTKALTKDRDERYQTAREMLTDIRRLKQRLDLATERERSFTPAFAKSTDADSAIDARPNADAEPSPAKKLWTRSRLAMLLAIGLMIAVVAGVIAWRSKASWFKRATPSGPPVVLLMDSPLPDRVYDEETRKKGGTNADDISDVLRDLPIIIEKENTSALWHREDQVRRENPALIVIHHSCFADADMGFDPQSKETQTAEAKVTAFLGYNRPWRSVYEVSRLHTQSRRPRRLGFGVGKTFPTTERKSFYYEHSRRPGTRELSRSEYRPGA